LTAYYLNRVTLSDAVVFDNARKSCVNSRLTSVFPIWCCNLVSINQRCHTVVQLHIYCHFHIYIHYCCALVGSSSCCMSDHCFNMPPCICVVAYSVGLIKKIHRVRRKMPLYFYQMMSDFQNSFTDRHSITFLAKVQ